MSTQRYPESAPLTRYLLERVLPRLDLQGAPRASGTARRIASSERSSSGCCGRSTANLNPGPGRTASSGLIGVRSPDWGMVDGMRYGVLAAVLLLAAPALAAAWNEIEGT